MRTETVVRVPGIALGPSPAPMARKLALIGGSGGIGQVLGPLLSEGFDVRSLSSADLDVTFAGRSAEWLLSEQPDILVFGAASSHDAMVHKLDAGDSWRQVAVTCLGLANVLCACLPPMRSRHFGRVIFLSSILARQPTPGAGIYGACKAFGEALIRTAAVENAGHGVTCNSIRMGYFDAGLKDRMSSAHQAAALETIPAGRWGSVVELARVIRCIVETEYINGATVDLTGGL